MPSIAAVLRTEKSLVGGRYPIVIRVIEERKRREIPVGWKIPKEFWDPKGFVKSHHPEAVLINATIETKRAEIAKAIVEQTVSGRPINLNLLGTKRVNASFTSYLRYRAKDYGERGMKIMSDRTTNQYVDDLVNFHGGEVYFDEINMPWIRNYEAMLVKRKNSPNTRMKKIRTLRDWFRDAINEGKYSGINPFEGYNIPKVPVKREKLSLAQVQAMENLNLTDRRELTRDMWLFSFYCKGMRFENVLFLATSSVRDGRVYWQSNKGKDFLSAKIHGKMQEIIDKYYNKKAPYLFPTTKERLAETKVVSHRRTWNVIVNTELKIIAVAAGIQANLTFHTARHTFAYAMKKKTGNFNAIKDALGHSNPQTTQMYLKALDDEAIDQEVDKVYEY